MLDGVGGDATQTVEFTPQTQSDLQSGNLSQSFTEALKQAKEEYGITTKKESETVVEPKEETKVEEPKVEDDSKKIEENQEEPKEPEAKEETDLETPEGEKVKATRISEVKNWGVEWKKTAEAREPAYKFIQDNFEGNLEEAEASAEMFGLIFGSSLEEFNPNKVLSELAQMSKPRAEKLIHFFADNKVVQEQAKQKVLSELFGADISEEEFAQEIEGYKIFKKVGGLSSLLDDNGDLPDNLRYDLDGNPRSEEEVDLLKSVFNELKSVKTERQTEKQRLEEEAKKQADLDLDNKISDYTEERFANVETAIDNLNLKVNASDSDEVKFQKSRDEKMIRFYVSGAVTEDQTFRETYKQAVDAIKQGDAYTANKLKLKLNGIVAKYTSEIVDDYIAKNNIKIEKREEQLDRAKDSKKEIEVGGGDFSAKTERKKNETVDEAIQRLIIEGKLDKSKFE